MQEDIQILLFIYIINATEFKRNYLIFNKFYYLLHKIL
jgi:hypothetical protein